uniref:Uncharacterized protein n=1 Tax=Oryza sativa subsp. japonica TaxID=39947 RepID=Q69U65_ORYSJ|nr:hypothetical protein [Oryza sativa Japonica Group]
MLPGQDSPTTQPIRLQRTLPPHESPNLVRATRKEQQGPQTGTPPAPIGTPNVSTIGMRSVAGLGGIATYSQHGGMGLGSQVAAGGGGISA